MRDLPAGESGRVRQPKGLNSVLSLLWGLVSVADPPPRVMIEP